jgi:uncharacterized delta-60 repeat protein
MALYRSLLLVFSAVFFASAASAGTLVDGDVDPSFGINGSARYAFDLGDTDRDAAPTATIDSLNRVVSFIEVATPSGSRIGMARHTAGGSLDASFDGDGKRILVLPLIGDLHDPKVLRAPDGKFYLLVRHDLSDTNFDWALCRLFVAGVVDEAFSADGCVSLPFNLLDGGRDYPTTMAFDPAGRMVVGGFAQTGTAFRAALARVNLLNGSIDGSFGTGGFRTIAFPEIESSRVFDLEVLDDSRIVLVGSARATDAPNLDILVARLTATGALDPSFFSGAGFRRIAFDRDGVNSIFSNDVAFALAPVPRSGFMTIVGRAQESASRSLGFVARLTQGGSLDGLFNLNGRVLFGFSGAGGGWFTDVKIDGRGRIYAYGQAEETDGDMDLVVARLGPDGLSNTNFGPNRVYFDPQPQNRDDTATELHFMDGKLLLVGSSLLSGQDEDPHLTRVWIDLIFADGAQ